MDDFGRLFGAGHEKGSVDNGLVWTLWMSLIHEFLRMQMSESIGILVPQPGIEPGPSAVKVLTFYNFFFIQKKKKKEIPNHSTAREFWEWTFFFFFSSHTFISLSNCAHMLGVIFSGILYEKEISNFGC